MKSPSTQKAYVTPTLAEHGRVIARTEGGIWGPIEDDGRPVFM